MRERERERKICKEDERLAGRERERERVEVRREIIIKKR